VFGTEDIRGALAWALAFSVLTGCEFKGCTCEVEMFRSRYLQESRLRKRQRKKRPINGIAVLKEKYWLPGIYHQDPEYLYLSQRCSALVI
jgi:hypothetical protein